MIPPRVANKIHGATVIIPIILAGSNIPSKGGQYNTVVAFYLTVVLGVVGGSENLGYT
jgi:hypothetical protein